jgi:hypothetical protein
VRSDLDLLDSGVVALTEMSEVGEAHWGVT